MKTLFFLMLCLLILPRIASSTLLEIQSLISEASQIAHFESEVTQIARFWERGIRLLRERKSNPRTNLDESTIHLNVFVSLPPRQQANMRSQFPEIHHLEQFLNTEKILPLEKKAAALRLKLAKKIQLRPDLVKKWFISYHNGISPFDNDVADLLLGINYARTEGSFPKDKYKSEEIWQNVPKEFTQTAYDFIRQIYKELKLTNKDVVYDLGSGYGRVIYYGAFLYPEVKFRGIELVAERAGETERIANLLKLPNVRFIAGDVLNGDFSDGSVFYLFNPFPSIMDKVLARLKGIAQKRKIQVVAHGSSVKDLASVSWLKLAQNLDSASRFPLAIFSSK